MSHTPEPWTKTIEDRFTRIGPQMYPICTVDHLHTDGDPHANADLIAAAPTMLRVLKAVRKAIGPHEYMCNTESGQTCSCTVPAIDAAIAKAEKTCTAGPA